MVAAVGLFATAWLALPAGGAPAPHVQPPVPVTRSLPNGLTVAVFEDHRLPLVQVQLLVRAGSAQEPQDEAGIANLTFQMLGHGTASRTAVAFDEAVQALGGSVGGGVSREFATVNGAFLSTDLETGLELLGDAVVNPLFEEDRLGAIKDQVAERRAAAGQDPGALADDHLWGTVFHGHPYGRPPSGAQLALNPLGIEQVRRFHRDRYRPDQAVLAIAGDVTPERAFKVAEDVLGSWGGRSVDVPAVAAPAPGAGPIVRIVDVPGLPRAELRLGAQAPSRGDADYEPVAVAAELLASSARPALRVTVTGLRGAGLLAIASSVSADSAGQEVARIRAAIGRALAQPPSAEALDEVKLRIAGRFALQLDSRGGLIAQWMVAAVYGGAGERLADHPDRLAAVTGDAVRAALARHLSPDRLVLVAIGPAGPLRSQLESVGPVEIVPADAASEVIELPTTSRAAPSPEQIARGRVLAGQAVAAHGGLQRLRDIKDSTVEGDVIVTPGPYERAGKFLQVRRAPDRFLFTLTIDEIRSTQVLDGERGWSRTGLEPAQVETLDSLGVVGLRSGNRSDLRNLLLAAADPASRVAWRGRERRDDRDTDVLEVVSAEGERRLLFLDVESHRLVAMEQNDGGHSTRRLYRNLRSVSGVLWPHQEERMLDGQRTMSLTLTRVALNTGVKDALFTMPGTAPATRPRPR
jgi:zinc protease